jgi:hypothetical protein
MSEHRSTRPSAPTRLAAQALGLLLLAAATLAAVLPVDAVSVTTAAAERPHHAARHWAGFRIPRNGRADGGWIGGYRVGRTPVFVTTPGRRPNHAGFRGVRPTGNVAGKKGATRRETSRAAWILSKYGGYRDARQAAAVDAAVQHLLSGGRWEVGGRRGAARIRATGDARTVRRFANVMLRQSRVSAGRYGASVTAASADVGGVTEVTVRVRDGRGGPVSGLPVTVTSPDGGPSVPAAGPIDAVTGDDGRAVVRLAAPLAGWRTVTARVGQVPEHRLLLRPPKRKRQAAVARGGARRVLLVSSRAPVRGPQSLSARTAPGPMPAGAESRVTASISGDGTPRTAVATLRGPFATSSAATCSGPSAGSVSATVTADGDHVLPPVRPAAGGFYAWEVTVDGTATSVPAAACSNVVRVQSRTSAGVSSDAATAVTGEVGATGSVSGLPFPVPVTLRGTLFGPYASPEERAADACTTSSIPAVTRTRTGNGSVHFTLEALAPGYYTWQVEVPAGELWLGSRSGCLTGGSLLQVG